MLQKPSTSQRSLQASVRVKLMSVSVSLRSLVVLVTGLVLVALGLAWAFASYTSAEKLRAFRQAVREQGPSRGGHPPTEEEVVLRTQACAEQQQVTVRDVRVESVDTQGLPGLLGRTQAGLAVMNTLQVRSRLYTVRGFARAHTLFWSREEPFEVQFSVQLSVTMAPSIETHAPSLPSEPSVQRGL
jgi:hypothetical protein